ncbi:embigin [Kryptolebias marmoratus]|nr:embigin [Kryptolebias marmoratus]
MTSSWKQQLVQVLLVLVSCGHGDTKTAAPTPTPLPPVTPLKQDAKSAVLTGKNFTERVELSSPVNMTLSCTWKGDQDKPPNITGHWRKDGQEIQDSRVTVMLEDENYKLIQVFSVVSEKDLGNYSCVFGNEARIDFILEVLQMGEKRDKPVVSYIRDFVVMTCKVEENKPIPTTWNWYTSNGTDKEQINTTASKRFKIVSEERETKLKVKDLTLDDAGQYYCGAVYPIGTSVGQVELKVITFMEPLKPFITILIEVVVLVAAILLYERSRAKKDSAEGTQTNAEQNTEPQGDDKGAEGNDSVRQRK